MKKILIVAIVLAMLAVMVGCSSQGEVKTGVGVVTSIAKSKDAGTDDDGNPKDGTAQVDTTIVAVTLDQDNKVVAVKIDVAQTRVSFDGAGMVTADKMAPVKTKKEKGADYGMIKASAIGREWFEQIEALEEWMVGKTVDQITGMKTVDSDGKTLTDEADLVSSVTVGIDSYMAAFEKAVANAK